MGKERVEVRQDLQPTLLDNRPQQTEITIEPVQEYEVFPGPVKTQLTKEVEDRMGEAIETLLQRYYFDEEKSAVEVGEILSVHENTVREWIHKYGFSTRTPSEIAKLTWSSPEKREQLIKGQKATWRDREKRKERIIMLHSPAAKEQRSKSIKEKYRTDPEYKPKNRRKPKR